MCFSSGCFLTFERGARQGQPKLFSCVCVETPTPFNVRVVESLPKLVKRSLIYVKHVMTWGHLLLSLIIYLSIYEHCLKLTWAWYSGEYTYRERMRKEVQWLLVIPQEMESAIHRAGTSRSKPHWAVGQWQQLPWITHESFYKTCFIGLVWIWH